MLFRSQRWRESFHEVKDPDGSSDIKDLKERRAMRSAELVAGREFMMGVRVGFWDAKMLTLKKNKKMMQRIK